MIKKPSVKQPGWTKAGANPTTVYGTAQNRPLIFQSPPTPVYARPGNKNLKQGGLE